MLTTAEMYVAAVLSGDKVLQKVFRDGTDFHSTIAKLVFNLPCSIDEVKEKYKLERQAAKAISFGILYGAGANKISAEITKSSGSLFTKEQAQEVIDDYFNKFKALKKWIEDNKNAIKRDGYVYSAFGRKRRLPDAKSTDKGTVASEVRSGLNFLVQSVASDVNLLAAIDTQAELDARKMGSCKIIALVHDCILAEVPEALVDTYVEIVAKYIRLDRGCNIPGSPIGFDVDIGDDYSMGKFEEKYGDAYLQFCMAA